MLNELEHQIISFYSKSITTTNIQEILSEIYDFDVNPIINL